MELRVLNYFLMVAREENITRAANLLHVTQPTLSRQLMQLEEELGVKLFERSSHNIILTEDGLLLKRRAQEIITLVDKTKNDFLQEEEISGEICIGSGEMMSMNVIAEVMEKFREMHPDVHFDIYSGDADGIKERIESGLLDIGLLLEPVDVSKYDFARIPMKETWGLMVRRDSVLAEKEYITPEDIAGIPIIEAKRATVQGELINWLGNYEDELDVVSTYNLIYNAVAQVKKGIGNLLCIKLEVEYEGVKFIPLYPTLELETVLVWKKNQTASVAVSAFTQFCKKQLQEMSKKHDRK